LHDDGTSPPRTVASRLTAILLTFRYGSLHSLTEIAEITGLPMSTVHRMAAELASWQLLSRTPDGRYEIGANLQQLAGDVHHRPDLDGRATLVVSDLCEVTRRRARLGVLRSTRVAYVEKRWGAAPPVPFSAGATLPAHATALGKALLAFAPRSRVAAVERQMSAYTAGTLTDPVELQRQLQTIRVTRIAESRGELVRGDWAVAAPVFGPGGAVIAALEIQVHDLREDIRMCRPALVVAARSLSRDLALDAPYDGPQLRLLPRAADDDPRPRHRHRHVHRGGESAAGSEVRRGAAVHVRGEKFFP
jgi:DNA-binding IclR family transcriptional regulator